MRQPPSPVNQTLKLLWAVASASSCVRRSTSSGVRLQYIRDSCVVSSGSFVTAMMTCSPQDLLRARHAVGLIHPRAAACGMKGLLCPYVAAGLQLIGPCVASKSAHVTLSEESVLPLSQEWEGFEPLQVLLAFPLAGALGHSCSVHQSCAFNCSVMRNALCL